MARSHYLSPVGASIAVTGTDQFNSYSGAWVYSEGIINATGKLVQANASMSCGDIGARVPAGAPAVPPPGCGGNLLAQGLGPAPFSDWLQYQPADRFWAFQGIESGIFLAMTVVLLLLAVRQVRRIV